MSDMMLTLVFETSSAHGGLALLQGERCLAERTFHAARGHNSRIHTPLGELLEQAGGVDRIGRFVVGLGPGSYTGVRVSVAVAQALSMASGAPLRGVCSFLGYPEEQDEFWVVGDARRGQFFRAHVRRSLPSVEFALGAREETAKVAGEWLAAGVPVWTPDESPLLPEIPIGHSRAERLGLAVAEAPGVDGPVEPIYLAAPFVTQPKKPGKLVGAGGMGQ